MPIKPDSLAESCQQHHREQFGSVSIERLCTKLLEEAGELAGTIIRDTEDRDGHNWKPAVKSELGDVLVALTVIAARYDLDLCKEAVDAQQYFISRKWINVTKLDQFTEGIAKTEA